MTEQYNYGVWVIVVFNIGLFLFFIASFLAPTGRKEWRNLGLVTAFLVALFTEMHGFPLTIYLLTAWLGEAYPVLDPFTHKHGHLWVVVFGGSDIAWSVVMGLSLLVMLVGFILLSKGWREIHRGHGALITDGSYAFARHPQYAGLFLVIIGFLIQWPTLLTVLMTPVLVYAYVLLARREEHIMQKHFGDTYTQYAHCTPMFFPPFAQWKAFITTSSKDVTES